MSRAQRLAVLAGIVAAPIAWIPATGSGAHTPPSFSSTTSTVTATELSHSYRPGCPVAPSRLRRLRLRYWGFDGKSHLGSLVVNTAVVGDVVAIFRRLYERRFPIRRMEPIEAFRGSDDASMAADNTSAFNCRYAVAPGPKRWSVHAYGEAIDVDPVENPYRDGAAVLPAAGAPYLDRAYVRPGMAELGGRLVNAFASSGWLWGGRWTGSPDYQHFSKTGG